ncbi:MAG TPA: protein-disulfide reductase DsbD N-terminal domain-containing protein [Bryobacteraceae bacterium]|nr:protein-disulfide reductase DsbD N-terminal domain-containing protein [Bryobacteraceae bacterium]
MRTLLTLLACAAPILAQEEAPKLNPVNWALSAPAAARPGERIQPRLTATIEEGWHLYSLKPLEGGPIATKIAVPAPQQFKLVGQVDAPVPLTAHEESFGMSVEFYLGEVEFTLPLEVNRDAKPGPHKLTVTARYQACDNKQCLPPKTVTVESSVTVK